MDRQGCGGVRAAGGGPQVIVAFTGGRNYSNRAMVEFVVDVLCSYEDLGSPAVGLEIRVGDCPTGLDAIVSSIDQATAKVYRADWSKHGKAAGPIRNGNMLRGGEVLNIRDTADLLIAFKGGAGTADCVRQARELGIPVLECPA